MSVSRPLLLLLGTLAIGLALYVVLLPEDDADSRRRSGSMDL